MDEKTFVWGGSYLWRMDGVVLEGKVVGISSMSKVSRKYTESNLPMQLTLIQHE